jgi:hypothetical protein
VLSLLIIDKYIELFIGISARSTDPIQESDIFMDSKRDDEDYYFWGNNAV